MTIKSGFCYSSNFFGTKLLPMHFCISVKLNDYDSSKMSVQLTRCVDGVKTMNLFSKFKLVAFFKYLPSPMKQNVEHIFKQVRKLFSAVSK